MSLAVQWVLLAWFLTTLATLITRIYAQAERRQRLATAMHRMIITCGAWAIAGPVTAILFFPDSGRDMPMSVPGRIFAAIFMGGLLFLIAGFVWLMSAVGLEGMEEAAEKERESLPVVPLPEDDKFEEWAEQWSETVASGNFRWEKDE